MQPDPNSLAFDIERALEAVVSLRTRIPEDALTASGLGTERAGHGVVIDRTGLILTIGYLITEAESVWLVDAQGRTVPGHVVGYDQETGFGLVQALQSVDWPVLELGNSSELVTGATVVVAGHGGLEQCIVANVIGKREFAGYWEYVLEEAIFTAPAHPNWGGAGVIASNGTLVGIGSLLVQQVTEEGKTSGANMIVPIDILKPILDDLRMYGRQNKPPRPWMGWLVQDVGDRLVVAGVYDDCPADRAGVRVGDVIQEVAGVPVSSLAELFRRIWSQGEAGVNVPLTLLRDGEPRVANVESADRNSRLKTGPIH